MRKSLLAISLFVGASAHAQEFSELAWSPLKGTTDALVSLDLQVQRPQLDESLACGLARVASVRAEAMVQAYTLAHANRVPHSAEDRSPVTAGELRTTERIVAELDKMMAYCDMDDEERAARDPLVLKQMTMRFRETARHAAVLANALVIAFPSAPGSYPN